MDTKVKELMIPVDQFPTVNQEATLFEAVTRLEQAHDTLAYRNFKPRAVLVVNDDQRIVGKLTLWDCLQVLEPKYQSIKDLDRLSHFGVNTDFIKSMVKEQELWNDPLDLLCQKAGVRKVKEFMSKPDEVEYISQDATLAVAVHQLVVTKRLSLLATEASGKVVGFLRLCDVFQFVGDKMKACEL